MTTRRTILRGLGTCVALPWLEQLMPVARAVDAGPSRVLLFMLPNGMPMRSWTPTITGSGWEATPMLAPIAHHRERATVITGLRQLPVSGVVESHMAASLGLLTGASVAPWALDPGVPLSSLDQRIAAHIGGETAFRSLELASEAASPCAEAIGGEAPSCDGYNTVSWADAATPLPPESSPRRAFDRVFAGVSPFETEDARRRRVLYGTSVLDAVKEDASRWAARLGSRDRARLDQYLTGVRELERRLEITAEPGECPFAPLAPAPPHDTPSHVGAMRDLMVAALACDQTRVISYMLGQVRSERPYPFLGIQDSHHWLSHHGDDEGRLLALEAIGAWEMAQVGLLLDQLAAVDLGGRTLLDDTLVLVYCAMSDPHSHADDDVPVVVFGGERASAGTHIQVPSDTPFASVQLQILDTFGAPRDGFAPEASPFTEL